MVVKLALCKISIFELVSVAEQADLSLSGRKSRRQVFLHRGSYNLHPYKQYPFVVQFKKSIKLEK